MTGKTLNTDTAVAADAERATDMTEPKITREFIERIRSRKEPISFAAMESLCDLALQAEAMQPRPIEEAPKDGTPILGFPLKGGPDIYFWDKNGEYVIKPGWATATIHGTYPPTHFIPLTALPEPRS